MKRWKLVAEHLRRLLSDTFEGRTACQDFRTGLALTLAQKHAHPGVVSPVNVNMTFPAELFTKMLAEANRLADAKEEVAEPFIRK